MARFATLAVVGILFFAMAGLATESQRMAQANPLPAPQIQQMADVPAVQLNLHILLRGHEGDVVGDVIKAYKCPAPGQMLIEGTNGSKWMYYLGTGATLLEICILTNSIESKGCRLITQIMANESKCLEEYALKASQRDGVKVTQIKGTPPSFLENLPNKVQEWWKWALGK